MRHSDFMDNFFSTTGRKIDIVAAFQRLENGGS
jgi:hypothetical protein